MRCGLRDSVGSYYIEFGEHTFWISLKRTENVLHKWI